MANVRDADLAKTIGRNITNRLIMKEKTQQDMCNDLKYSKATVSAWVNGTRTPKMDRIDEMCRYFDCTREDLMLDAREAYRKRSFSVPAVGVEPTLKDKNSTILSQIRHSWLTSWLTMA